jgi:hypothetical protein
MYLDVVLIGIPLVAKDIEHFVIYLLAIYTSYEKYLISSFID